MSERDYRLAYDVFKTDAHILSTQRIPAVPRTVIACALLDVLQHTLHGLRVTVDIRAELAERVRVLYTNLASGLPDELRDELDYRCAEELACGRP